jgi:hypothetical protein
MVDSNDDFIVISHGNNPLELFPGYHPPAKEERREVYRRGLVSADANALLDLYRFSERARNEYFKVLEELRPRLFITHQAASEFYRNRLSVVESRLGAAEEKCTEIKKPLDTVIEKIREFANRYQIDERERQRLIGLVGSLSSDLSDSILAAGAYDMTNEQVKNATDSVLGRVESLLDERIGNALSDAAYKQAVAEATRRREARIPPGYADVKKKSPEQQAGDYLVWRQLINEAQLHGRPVLLVTDESKEDWVLEGPSGQILGPRPELVLEMRKEANVQLHMVSVAGLLKEAPDYLGATISASTIQEATSFPERRHVDINFTLEAMEQYDRLPENDRLTVSSVLDDVRNRIRESQTLENLPGVYSQAMQDDIGVVQLRDGVSVYFRIQYESADTIDLVVNFVGRVK